MVTSDGLATMKGLYSQKPPYNLKYLTSGLYIFGFLSCPHIQFILFLSFHLYSKYIYFKRLGDTHCVTNKTRSFTYHQGNDHKDFT